MARKSRTTRSPSVVGKQAWLADECRRTLRFDPDTGEFYRSITTAHFKENDRVGYSIGQKGHKNLRVSNHMLGAHRVAWLMHYGRWPAHQIDHINGIPGDNRICNLREATFAQNSRNAKMRKDNTSGFKGVYRYKSGKWCARIKVDGKYIHLGTYTTPADAYSAYCRGSDKYHKEFGRK